MQVPPPSPTVLSPGWFAANALGLFYAFLSVAAVVLLLHWAAWVFGWGRFKAKPRGGNESVISVTNTFLTKIILDFRNFLALLIVLIFAVVLAVAFGVAGTHVNQMNAIQVVTASLGPLVGSLMGYYFGERAALARPGDGGGGGAAGGGVADGGPAPTEIPAPADDDDLPAGITLAPAPGDPGEPAAPVPADA